MLFHLSLHRTTVNQSQLVTMALVSAFAMCLTVQYMKDMRFLRTGVLSTRLSSWMLSMVKLVSRSKDGFTFQKLARVAMLCVGYSFDLVSATHQQYLRQTWQ